MARLLLDYNVTRTLEPRESVLKVKLSSSTHRLLPCGPWPEYRLYSPPSVARIGSTDLVLH